jgi:NDP-sugar pyrophosphorylase family protein
MTMEASYQGVILAAGKGSRMQPFSEHWPKPLLPVLGKPLMVYQLEMLVSLGVRDVVVVIGHLGQEIVRALGDGSRYGVKIRYVEQGEVLGIAHAVGKLEPHLDRPFFLFLGDIYFATANFAAMVEPLRLGRAEAVLACKREPDIAAMRRNFAVMLGADGYVSRVVEKPRSPRTDLKGCGIYLFDPEFFDAVRRTPRTALRNEYEITDSIQLFLEAGHKVMPAEVVVEDVNVSYPADLLALNLQLLRESGAANWRAPTAQLSASAKLERVIAMDGSAIGAGAALRDCLLFPGAQVPAGHVAQRSIFIPGSEIRCDDVR